MIVEFIQYLRPDGRPRRILVPRPDHVAQKADQIAAAGFRFEAEILSTNEASFTISDDESDYAITVTEQGAKMFEAVDRLILNFDIDAATRQRDQDAMRD